MQNSFSYERFRTRFETEAQKNSEMIYLFEFEMYVKLWGWSFRPLLE